MPKVLAEAVEYERRNKRNRLKKHEIRVKGRLSRKQEKKRQRWLEGKKEENEALGGYKMSHMDVKLLEHRVQVQTWQRKKIQESSGRNPGSDQP